MEIQESSLGASRKRKQDPAQWKKNVAKKLRYVDVLFVVPASLAYRIK